MTYDISYFAILNKKSKVSPEIRRLLQFSQHLIISEIGEYSLGKGSKWGSKEKKRLENYSRSAYFRIVLF